MISIEANFKAMRSMLKEHESDLKYLRDHGDEIHANILATELWDVLRKEINRQAK